MISTAPGGHFGICGPLSQVMLTLRFMRSIEAGCHVDVLGLSYHQSHVGAHGLCCTLKPWKCHQAAFLQKVMSGSMVLL